MTGKESKNYPACRAIYVNKSSVVIALAALVEVAAAQTVPLPRPRPLLQSEALPAETATPPTPTQSACRVRLTAERAIARSIDSIEGPGGCGSVDLVRLEAVMLSNGGSRVEIRPPAVLRCAMAEAVVDWVRDDLAKLAVVGFGSPLRSVQNYAAYHCRSRNNILGAIMSEHGKGNALDVGSITLANGMTIEPTDPKVSREFREGWKSSVCARFSTVLGPGSDQYHENHIHVDLKERRNGYSMCQWEIRLPDTVSTPAITSSVPLPQPRPKVDLPSARK
jgi:hypothetical protein